MATKDRDHVGKKTEFPKELVMINGLADQYSRVLSPFSVVPNDTQGHCSSWAQYTLLVYKRDQMPIVLNTAGIPSLVYYAICIHQQTAFVDTNQGSDFSAVQTLTKKVHSLTIHPYFAPQQQQQIIAISI